MNLKMIKVRRTPLAIARKLRFIDRQLWNLYDKSTYPEHLIGLSEFYIQRWVADRRIKLEGQRAMIIWLNGGKYDHN